MADGLIGTGATYRDRALSGIVAESGLAQKRELATQAFKEQKMGGILSTTEKGIMDVIKIVASIYGMGGMVPEQKEKTEMTTGSLGEPTEAAEGRSDPLPFD